VNERVLILQFDESESQRLDHFLVSQMPKYSRSYLQTLIEEKLVKVDGGIAYKSGMKLEGVHEIEVRIPPFEPTKLIPEYIPLDIVYEDKDVIVVNKPAGMVVHPSVGHNHGTLIHAVLAHAPVIEGVGGVVQPGLVHRLDKNTSGLIVLAKNDLTHRFLQEQFKRREVEKGYVALVDGNPPTPEGRVEASIGRDPRNRQRFAIVPDERGRMALSEYRTLEIFEGHTLLEVKILTGRTHQIRLHMAFIKCPVAGDAVYGYKQSTIPISRQFLHAAFLGFTLPGQSNQSIFKAPLPEELEQVLASLRH